MARKQPVTTGHKMATLNCPQNMIRTWLQLVAPSSPVSYRRRVLLFSVWMALLAAAPARLGRADAVMAPSKKIAQVEKPVTQHPPDGGSLYNIKSTRAPAPYDHCENREEAQHSSSIAETKGVTEN